MKCPYCGTEMLKVYVRAYLTYPGDYWTPPEYKVENEDWYCQECGTCEDFVEPINN
jgi:uncharacterized protein with PIN domain